ncbi:MAG TPA: RNA 2',3'-cyclic phosphodiesterase [Candidatus Limnocylindrales bacterium]|nr:RNA 2',3'-cyclic phosphodiesterase [Candidatus Limnocylindrales bacterium]
MRLFIAIFPPPAAIAHLKAAMSTLDIKLSDPGRWHLTLAFLGEVPEAGPATAALTEAELNPIGTLEIRGGGKFGTVLWAGVEGDLEALTRLTRSIRRSLRAKRVPPDDKKFRPHLTLARRTQPGQMAEALKLLRNYDGPIWHAHEAVLVRSELGAHPSYHQLSKVEIPR